jgi:erythrin-vacuolar iron transport family protein
MLDARIIMSPDEAALIRLWREKRLKHRSAENGGPALQNVRLSRRIWKNNRRPSKDVAMRNFDELSEREMLALAISNEEEDSRIYADFADGLSENYPASAQVFTEMAAEENEHRRRLIDLFASKFGEHIPLIRRQDVRGYIPQKPVWQARPLGIETVRAHAHEMELAAVRFYRQATARTSDASIRKLLGDLAEVEDTHDRKALNLEKTLLTDSARHSEEEGERRRFVLQIIQPGLVGLMDGSVSTLAPVFAAAFATHS